MRVKAVGAFAVSTYSAVNQSSSDAGVFSQPSSPANGTAINGGGIEGLGVLGGGGVGMQQMEELMPWFGMAAFLGVLFVTWVCTRFKSNGPGKRQGSGSDTWLAMLVAASVLILLWDFMLLLIMGKFSQDTALGYPAGSAMIYLAAFIAEKVKGELTNYGVASKLDTVVGSFSILFVVSVSIYELVVAFAHLDDFPRLGPLDGRLVGVRVGGFAIVGLFANTWLLMLRSRVVQDVDHEDDQGSPALETSSAPMEAAASPIKSANTLGDVPRSFVSQNKLRVQQADTFFSSPDSWLQIFQPRHGNMNVFGATLHLVADACRVTVALASGIMLETGILADIGRTVTTGALVNGFFAAFCATVFFYHLRQLLESSPSCSV